ncbi:cyclic nucleotide-gated ion channel 1-like [Benincasa hispida]|uniref:cyclic nucleotide-gated ion channel 1-like n=1 Tax=Benincasa hispida TaxID=102211 RepID=UPI0018FF97F5|nr:cyclic nucleotide-gated ion channel 1-like [Benincasa hispida]
MARKPRLQRESVSIATRRDIGKETVPNTSRNRRRPSKEINSWRQLEVGEMTMQVGTGASSETEQSLKNQERRKFVLQVGFLISSITAVCLDVLFFYIHYIDDEKKCFAVDDKVKNAAIAARSVTDSILLLEVIYKICSSSILQQCATHQTFFGRLADVGKRVPWMNVIVDLLALLPLPQIIMLVMFERRKSIKYLNNRWRMILLPLFQFIPRVIRIYLLCKELSRSAAPNDITGTGRVRGTFNFFLFILASHVVGAFWYCFSVIRELHCWQHACKFNSGCRVNTFFCDDITGNERFVDEFCPINPPDPAVFDFGIFLDAHQSGISRVKDFQVKLIYCFSWGLRALSSFGSNLKTSSYSCENIFAALVTIVGILLVVYLIGNLQVYLQSATSRSEERRRMMQNKDFELKSWIKEYELQEEEKEILQYVRDKFEGKNDVNLKTLLDVFPPLFVEDIKRKLCLNIPRFGNVDDEKLEKIIKYMKPVVFAEQSYIIQEEEPVEQILLFTKGTALAFSRETGTVKATKMFVKGDLFGQSLLEWAATNGIVDEIPLSQWTLKTETQMEAFAIKRLPIHNIIRNTNTFRLN